MNINNPLALDWLTKPNKNRLFIASNDLEAQKAYLYHRLVNSPNELVDHERSYKMAENLVSVGEQRNSQNSESDTTMAPTVKIACHCCGTVSNDVRVTALQQGQAPKHSCDCKVWGDVTGKDGKKKFDTVEDAFVALRIDYSAAVKDQVGANLYYRNIKCADCGEPLLDSRHGHLMKGQMPRHIRADGVAYQFCPKDPKHILQYEKANTLSPLKVNLSLEEFARTTQYEKVPVTYSCNCPGAVIKLNLFIPDRSNNCPRCSDKRLTHMKMVDYLTALAAGKKITKRMDEWAFKKSAVFVVQDRAKNLLSGEQTTLAKVGVSVTDTRYGSADILHKKYALNNVQAYWVEQSCFAERTELFGFSGTHEFVNINGGMSEATRLENLETCLALVEKYVGVVLSTPLSELPIPPDTHHRRTFVGAKPA